MKVADAPRRTSTDWPARPNTTMRAIAASARPARDRAGDMTFASRLMSAFRRTACVAAILPSRRKKADDHEGDQDTLRGHEVAERKGEYVDKIERLHEARHDESE